MPKKSPSLKLKELLLSFLMLLKLLQLLHSQKTRDNHGMLELQTMLLELLLLPLSHPKLKMKIQELLKTKTSLIKQLKKLLLLRTLSEETEKTSLKTTGMNTGSLKLSHNQQLMLMEIISNSDQESQAKKRRRPLKPMDQARRNKKLRKMTLHQQNLLFNLHLKENQAELTQKRPHTKKSMIPNKLD